MITIGGKESAMYDIYPCDLTMFGECPKRVQDCGNCVGWMNQEEEDEDGEQ